MKRLDIALGTLGNPATTRKRVARGTARRMLGFAAPYTWLLVGFLVIVVADAALGVAHPLIFRQIINDGILGRDVGLIVQLALLVAGLGVVGIGVVVLQTYLSSAIGARLVLALRTQLFQHIQKMPIAFFSRTQTGALVSRLNSDIAGARTAFTDLLSSGIGSVVTVILTLAAMFALSWRITLVIVALIPMFILPARYLGRKLQAITREGFGINANMNNMLVERFNVSGAILAKLFGRPADEERAFAVKAGRVAAIGVKQALYSRFLFAGLLLAAALANALAYGWGGVLVVQGALDVGTIVALVAFLARLYPPLMGLSNIQASFMTALVSFERVFEILDLRPMIEEKPDAVEIPGGPVEIRFRDVSFRYPVPAEVSLASLESIAVPASDESRPVLHGMAFTAKAGELVALVGPSGSGKTTITSLISRFYDVRGGAVEINGVDVRDARLESLRARIGVVTQDPYMFHDTIRANLLYARPDASDAQIEAALAAAQLLNLIRALPDGLDTIVGEHGHHLSGGERQRLAIARVLLKAPDIVILDEATAHLDSESEAAVQFAFENAFRSATTIVIAHRLSTVRRADQILVIKEGRIVERGTHENLAAASGMYSELYQRQFLGAQTP